MGFFSREKADEEKAVELLKGEERGESRLPIFAGGWSSGKKGGEGLYGVTLEAACISLRCYPQTRGFDQFIPRDGEGEGEQPCPAE